jgi:hypothetical protein
MVTPAGLVGVFTTGVVLGPGAPVSAGVGLAVPPRLGGSLPIRVGVVVGESTVAVGLSGKPLMPAPPGSRSRKMSRLISGTRRAKESTL